MLEAGTDLDGKYTIVGTLGDGGFGSVYLAEHHKLERKVAIKILHSTLKLAPNAVPRFELEAKALHALKHRNIVTFYGYGLCADGAPYMVIEYLHGQPLNQLLRDGPLEPARAVRIAEQLLDALACAHSNGFIHRDLKPNNIMVADNDEAKVIDFGLAKLLPEGDATLQRLTETGFTLGSFQYAAPEQAFGSTADARSDIYSAGCIFYRMLSGEPPFDGDDPMTLMQQHISRYPPKLRVPDEFPGLATFVANCMAKLPEERYQCAADALADLELVKSGKPVEARVSNLSLHPQRKSSKRISILVFGAVLAVVAGFGWYLQRAMQSDSVAATAEMQTNSDTAEIERIAKSAFNSERFDSELFEIEARESRHRSLAPYPRYLLATQLANLYLRKVPTSDEESLTPWQYRNLARSYLLEAWQAAKKNRTEQYWSCIQSLEVNARTLNDSELVAEMDREMIASPFLEVRQSARSSMVWDLKKQGRNKEALALATQALREGGASLSVRNYLASVCRELGTPAPLMRER